MESERAEELKRDEDKRTEKQTQRCGGVFLWCSKSLCDAAFIYGHTGKVNPAVRHLSLVNGKTFSVALNVRHHSPLMNPALALTVPVRRCELCDLYSEKRL